jgi:hypothetical protein
MSGNDPGGENFEEMLRSLAAELGRYIERSIDSVDLDEFAGSVGVDPAAAREWFESAGGWLSAQTENLGEELARRSRGQERQGRPERPEHPLAGVDPLGAAGPHPLDQPSDEQGMALAALDSGRWIIEPGTDALAARGEGPGPSDALGIVRELRVRDWIAADGKLTATGHHALSRWLDAADPH